jgi:polyhydroxyalkanoate synthesis regulator phasin
MKSIEKALYLGMGAVSLTKEKAESIANDLVTRGEMSAKDRGAMVQRLIKEGEAQKGQLEKQVSVLVQKAVTDMGLPTQKDLKGISKRLDAIEKSSKNADSGTKGTKA